MYPKIAQYKTVAALRERLAELDCEIPLDDAILTAEQGSPLAAPLSIGGFEVGNRWCVHPMEGWDAAEDGSPSEHTIRRWRNFGASGAKLIWGGEAAAVLPEGRANPRQTLATPDNLAGLRALLDPLHEVHRETCGSLDGLLVGLQLTHSGRFSRPTERGAQPKIAYRHPVLDARLEHPHANDLVWTDDELERLIDRFVAASRTAAQAGFQFVDVKACHGYALHEFLSARDRPGRFGGDLAGRSRLLLTILERIRSEVPGLMLGVRLSVFDTAPFRAVDGHGVPAEYPLPYNCGFGVDPNDPLKVDLSEPIELLRQLALLGVAAVNLSCGSPYYCPHAMRPASFPPSDGYPPPEDPLVGVARQIVVARACKQAVPNLPMVGSGYSYLQDYVIHAAQAVVRAGWVDAVGLGRMMLSHWDLPRQTLAEGRIDRKRVCRTFSDCTTAPRNGLISGCFPLDGYYKAMPEAETLATIKRSS